MVLADPGRAKSKLFGQHRLVAYLDQELLGRARIVGVAVVAQREIAEFHGGGWLLVTRLTQNDILAESFLVVHDARPILPTNDRAQTHATARSIERALGE